VLAVEGQHTCKLIGDSVLYRVVNCTDCGVCDAPEVLDLLEISRSRPKNRGGNNQNYTTSYRESQEFDGDPHRHGMGRNMEAAAICVSLALLLIMLLAADAEKRG
jgi:hypothetical protein